jgi:hypothetical protein
MVNVQFQIFNKSGVSVFGPADFNTLFQGFGGTCESSNDGDPIVLYDQLADRWMLTQFAEGPASECIAISATGDPTGSYHRYAFATPSNRFPDYPKFGVWPDGYYMTANEPDRMGIYAFDRAKMLLGQAATYIYFQNQTDTWGGLLPTDLDGTTLPPAGSPNYIIGHRDNQYYGAPNDVLKVFKFHADFGTPANSTFTLAAELLPAPYDGIVCPNLTFSCIRQPGTSQRLDAIGEWTMHRMAYRNFGTHESIVFNHTVDAVGNDQGNAGIRWYELRGLSTTPVIHQQGTYAPDANARWMGSMAMDVSGNIAVGFSAGGSALMPSPRYAGRLASDPLGQLSQGEATFVAGGGVQTGSNRWGDYSQLAVDPTDDCTFWYTSEYYQTTSGATWRTRIGSFKFPNCSQGTPTPTVTGTPATATPAPTGTSILPTTTVAPTGTRTNTATATATATATNVTTAIATNTAGTTPTTQFTATRTSTAIGTVIASSTPVITNTPLVPSVTATATACAIEFSDVPTTNTFYANIRCLVCRGIIGGYDDGTFRPFNDITRGQIAKIVSNAAGFDEDPGSQIYEDVPEGSPFYAWINRLSMRGHIGGYPCGLLEGEPCIEPDNLPYFRPSNSATRGQLSKIVANAAGIGGTPTDVFYTDVQEDHTFYLWIMRLTELGVMSGYDCGGDTEPCDDQQRPYFRPFNNVTRGQASKIVANTFFPGCQTPSR